MLCMEHHSIRIFVQYWGFCSQITSAMAKVMFSPLSVARVCLFVCLSVCLLATLRKNGWMDFHEIIRIGGTWYKEQLGYSWYSIQPLEHRTFSHFFGEIHDSKQHCNKTIERIFMKFSEKDRLDTKSNLEHFRVVTVNTLSPGSIDLFLGSVFVCNIVEKRVHGFSWFFYEMAGTTQEIIS